ncbi:MAG: flagellin [Lachnospira sp.]
MRIGTNISAIISNNALQKSQNALSASIERLSSGYKINRSSDNPAGCAISEKMRVQIRGLDQANNNTADGISVINTAEGAIAEIQSMLTRMKELTVQAANDVNSDEERSAIQAEINQINMEIDRISEDTEFNTQSLINGNLSRRVYSDLQGVHQLGVSDNYTAGIYGITIKQDARQAVAVGNAITMSGTATITKEQQGVISVNGYDIQIEEGDDLNNIINKLVDGVNKTGGKAFAVAQTTNDTAANGTEYAGYTPAVTNDYSGLNLVFMTNEYGRDQMMNVTCSNEELANLLGLSDAYIPEDSADNKGLYAEGSDVVAEFTTTNENGVTERVGFADSAVLSSKGTVITVKDVNNKEFIMDVPGNAAGTVFDDTSKTNFKSAVTSSTDKAIEQEVTDVGTMSIHVGANENQVIIIDIPEITTYTLGTDTLNVMTSYTAQLSIAKIDAAVSKASETRSKFGAYINRFDHTTNNLDTSTENLTSALSTMTDTNMAEEMTEYTSQTVLTQAATSILSQANQRPSEVLQLLQ